MHRLLSILGLCIEYENKKNPEQPSLPPSDTRPMKNLVEGLDELFITSRFLITQYVYEKQDFFFHIQLNHERHEMVAMLAIT